jgi:hypothetical protein
MGLDMYLSAKRYLWSDKDKEVAKDINDAVGVECDPEKRFAGSSLMVKEVSIDAMYWRKANAIHGWFVEKCQGGRDECQETYIPREKLVELRDLCKDILENPDAERDEDLEPTKGFFFGSYEKDEWYWQDLKNTVEGITSALESLPENQYEFYYQASW